MKKPMTDLPSGTVTFLFTDVQDSTRLWEKHPTDMRQALKRHDEIIENLAQQHNGVVVRPRGEGDSRFVVFERAIDGVSAAAEIQHAFQVEPWPDQTPLQVRIAIHTGEGEFCDGDYYGSAVNRCARLRSIVHGGQTVLSQATYELVQDILSIEVKLADLGEKPLKGLKRPEHIYQVMAPGLPAEFPPLKSPEDVEDPPAPGKPPFKGLQHFDEADAGLFFGRELLVAKIISRLRETIYPDRISHVDKGNFLALIVGASGSGKSSLVRAGLVPALKHGDPLADGCQPPKGSKNWPVHIITPGAHPLESLAISITQGSESVSTTATLIDDMKGDARSLHLATFHILGTDKPQNRLLVVVDQFEEIFTLCRDETERKAFIDNLLTAAAYETAGPTIVVIVMRADFYAQCAQYSNLREALANRQEYIGAMTPKELRRAVEEPARLGDWEFEPGLVDLLLQDVGDEPGALPLLSHALLETWNRRRGRTMTFTGYAESGGVRGAIAKTAQRVYWRLTPDEESIARNLFLRLTELGEVTDEGGTPSPDTRRRVSLTELLPDSAKSPEKRAATESVLQTLVEARLVTTAEETAEVAHEALIREWPTLREWLNEDREGLRLHRRLTLSAADWEGADRSPGFLLRGSHLDQFEKWAGTTDLALTAVERDFLDASLAERQAREVAEAERQTKEVALERRSRIFLRALVGVFAVAALIAIILSGVAINQRGIAQQNAATAMFAQGRAHNEAATAVAAQEEAVNQAATAFAAQHEAFEAYSESISVHARQALQSKDPISALSLAITAVDLVEQPLVQVQQTLMDIAHAPGPRHRFTIDELFEGNARFITSIAFSPDGRSILIGSDSGIIILFDLETMSETLRIKAHLSRVNELVFSPNGNTAISAGHDTKVILWDLATGRKLQRFEGHTGSVTTVDFSPDGLIAATGGFNNNDRREPGELILWDVKSGKEIQRCTDRHQNAVIDVVFSPNGLSLLASSGANTDSLLYSGDMRGYTIWTSYPDYDNDYELILWDVENCGIIQQFDTHEHDNFSLAMSEDPRWALSGSTDHNIYIWDMQSGQKIGKLQGHQNPVTTISISEDGTKALTGDAYTHQIILWDLEEKEPINYFNIHGYNKRIFDDIEVTIDTYGQKALSCSADGSLVLWDLIDMREIYRFDGHLDIVTDLEFTPDNQYLLSSSGRHNPSMGKTEDNSVRLWNIESGEQAKIFAGHNDGVTSIAVSSDGKNILSGSVDRTIRLWDFDSGTEIRQLEGHGSWVTNVEFVSQDFIGLSSPVFGNSILWDLATGRYIHTLSIRGDTYELSTSPDGKVAITGGGGGTVFLWDLETGYEINYFWGHVGEDLRIGGIDISPDGRFAITGDTFGKLIQWDIATREEIHRFTGHSAAIADVSISPDATQALSCDEGGTLILWDLEAGASIGRFQPPYEGTMYACEISPDGSMAAFNVEDTVYLWKLDIPELDELLDWIKANRYVRELTCEERARYVIEPLCEE